MQGELRELLADVTITIEFSPQARRHMLEEADDRWTGEHGTGDNPLLDEVARAADLLRDTPELGVVYRRGDFRRDIRRLLLRSGWHLYYSYDADRSVIVIVAVSFASRGSGPRL